MKGFRAYFLAAIGIGVIWIGLDMCADVYLAYTELCDDRPNCESIASKMILSRYMVVVCGITLPATVGAFLVWRDRGYK
jgi:hypothetical protein